MKLKKFNDYQHLNEDEGEDFGQGDDVNKYFVPKKVVKWFTRLGITDYRSAINDLRSKGYVITEDTADYNDLEM
jgi:hypothetical protein